MKLNLGSCDNIAHAIGVLRREGRIPEGYYSELIASHGGSVGPNVLRQDKVINDAVDKYNRDG